MRGISYREPYRKKKNSATGWSCGAPLCWIVPLSLISSWHNGPLAVPLQLRYNKHRRLAAYQAALKTYACEQQVLR